MKNSPLLPAWVDAQEAIDALLRTNAGANFEVRHTSDGIAVYDADELIYEANTLRDAAECLAAEIQCAVYGAAPKLAVTLISAYLVPEEKEDTPNE